MQRTNKHASSSVTFNDFSGGINVSQTGEQIGQNEMQVCENFIYGANSKKLVGRGGTSPLYYDFNSDIKELFYDVDTNTIMIFLEDLKIYSLVLGQEVVHIGNLTGGLAPVCSKFQNKIWIASGAKLQYYDFSGAKGLNTVLGGPNCDICFERFARLAVCMTGSDRISFSGVGDGAYWEEDTNDASASQFLEVGYGDSGDIVAVVPLATDLMFIKSNGKVYQLVGDRDISTWMVNNVANNTDAIGIRCAANIGSEVVFLSMRGLKALSTTMDYGNIAPSDIGDKFNALITKGLYEPKMFHLRRHSAILISPRADRSYLIAFNYLVGAATVLKFPLPITTVVETTNEVLIASGKVIYKWSKEFSLDDQIPISYRLKLKDIIGANKMLVKAIDTKFGSDRAGVATVSTSTLKVEVPTNSRKKVRCNHSTDCVSLVIESASSFSVDHLVLEVTDL